MTVAGPLDAMFLLGETRKQPMHVAGLLLFDLPEDAGDDFVGRLYRRIIDGQTVNPMFGRRLRHRAANLGYWSWEPEDAIDLEYHVRLSRLPEPGRFRELFELTSRLHGTLLDKRRPLWELHLIEGVRGDRFAMYHKVHHAMMDGVTALRWMQGALSEDPERVGMPATFALPKRPSGPLSPDAGPRTDAPLVGAMPTGAASKVLPPKAPPSNALPPNAPGSNALPPDVAQSNAAPLNALASNAEPSAVAELGHPATSPVVQEMQGRPQPVTQAARPTAIGAAERWVARTAGRAGGVVRRSSAGLRRAGRAIRPDDSAGVFQAPQSILNGPISAERRFAAESWSIERLTAVRTSTGTTLNDVMLAMCAGALRNYLLDLDALPERGLIAMVPVSLRGAVEGEGPGGANSLAALMCDLGTDEPTAGRRLQRVQASMSHGKEMLSELNPWQNLMVGAVGVASAGPAAIVPGLAGRIPPPYNLVISNVPGPVESQLYWDRAKLVGMYPASVLMNGQALNISATSYDCQLHFGLIGCRRTLPHLQRMLVHLEAALVELEDL